MGRSLRPRGATAIELTGGLGRTAGMRTVSTTSASPSRPAPNSAFLGDYTQFNDVTITIDVLVDKIEFFGNPVTRPWVLELRDFDTAQGGFPWTSVWYKLDNISETTNSSWRTYAVTITDPTSATLPPEWEGYGDEDPNTFEPILPPGVTFADVLSGVDQIAFTTLQPGIFFGTTLHDVTIDNVSITTNGQSGEVGPGGFAGEPQRLHAGSDVRAGDR